jgi:hypothetical protein
MAYDRQPHEARRESVMPATDDKLRSKLEADLRANWAPPEMTVYADYLQSIGDPRGELIAIDLVNMSKSQTGRAETKWATRRRALLAAWLGDELAEKLETQIFQGFLQATSDREILESPAGEFVRACRIQGAVADIRTSLAQLAARPRPWLSHLAITAPAPERGAFCVPRPVLERLVAATPHLDSIVLDGSSVVDHLAHPAVRFVRTEGPAIGTLIWSTDSLATTIPFVLHHVGRTSHTRLDLARTSGPIALAEILLQPAIRRHVTHLRLRQQPALTARLISSLEALLELEVITPNAAGLRGFMTAMTKLPRTIRVVVIERRAP